ncbi:MAG: DegT/DnrJ/EryC1/StrS family aminotransferase [Bacteroidota bacterium]
MQNFASESTSTLADLQVPFVDLKAQYLSIKTDIDQAIASVIEETAFIKGKYVNAFETAFAELYGVKHCIGVANGTDALYIALKMMGVGMGDEVITVANSWISSSETITQTGARPVFVDVDEYFTMDIQQLEQAITEKTKAIVPVHLTGQMVAMDQVMALAKKYDLQVLEDCAQSHFSAYKGKRAGLFGAAATFSFYPGKNLGAYGDAGCIITNNDELAEKMRIYANHGALVKHQHVTEGINSRLDGLQASILCAKLPYILDWTAARIRCAAIYDELLQDLAEVEIPKVRPQSKHTFHLYRILAKDRDGLKESLKEKNISTAIHYPTPLPFLPAYDYLNAQAVDFPRVLSNQSQILSLPIYPELTLAQQEYVVNQIRSFYAQ